MKAHTYNKYKHTNDKMQQKADEKIDPLTRIQEEIKEVVRREEEYRQLVASSNGTPPVIEANYKLNGNVDAEPVGQQEELLESEHDQDRDRDQGVLVTAQPAAATLLVPIEEQSPSNTPSLASSVNSNSHKEESLDEHHSDDSGISASSQKTATANGGAGGKQPLKLTIVGRQEQRYIGPNCYNLTPEPPQQKLMTRTISTPQLHGQQQQKRQFAFNSATKGVMQRFIASHGKLQLGSVTPPASTPLILSPQNGNGNNSNSSNNNNQTLKLNARNAMAFLDSGNPGSPLLNGNSNNNTININNNNNTLSQGAIERDSEGRPLRRGYVPVEQKIQRELQDLKSRETELKRLRKLNRQHMLDKLQLSTDDEADADDDDDSEVEHCYGPGKLRNAQSTVELDRESNDVELLGHKTSGNRSLNVAANGNGNALTTNGSSSGLRPAMSLAELCDLTPEEAPSSHRLIAQWESLIKKNAEGIEAAI
ncbi:myb-like protein D isoform X1 [Drosophila albomicans]|uniref:Myb-like protein D isoform X1 n=2 Tax=Drosophila albomicans TaxID=7291 RepID=A0A9C6W6A3_DROAB|nr:myb-like protein D isoform X1 [Drosophila albomicans]